MGARRTVRAGALLVAIAAAGAAAACRTGADGPPRIDVDRTACAHCGMLISEPVYAAAYQARGAEARVFDDIKCLLEAAGGEPDRTSLRFWFHDARDGAWIAGDQAVFVAAPSLRTPMGGGLVAFRDPAGAKEAAARHGGRVVPSLDRLMAQAEGGS